ncbi:MAG: PQQ-binding-like beta-propeller repeat protein [Acidobacteria bacterium]|nr:PQQ-binding-like beta-propeller repeat protein [Acidobacteriota bacterium]
MNPAHKNTFSHICIIRSLIFFVTTLLLSAFSVHSSQNSAPRAAQEWSAKLDSEVRFYQTTELGVLVAGTDKSLYALDGESGDVLWRRKTGRLDETDVAPVIGTDLLLLNLEKNGKTRIEAIDLLTGNTVWQSDKLRGSVMHLALEPDNGWLAIVLVRDAKGKPSDGCKRKPAVHLLHLATGEELWRYELESEIQMMPTRWFADDDKETLFTLDNYRAPLFADNRLFLFYEGVTGLAVQSGKELLRERFRINEEGLALTEADPVADAERLYVSGRGRVRALSRATGKLIWEAKDLGLTPELLLTGESLFVRTGGRFSQLKDGEIVKRGPYGVSAIDSATGKIRWRFRGADKGLTNLALASTTTIMLADDDELLSLDAATGRVQLRSKHRIRRPAFVLLNERGEVLVGGQNELAAFDPLRGGEAFWRVAYDPPGRGVLRVIAAIAARSAALYFRYGGVATTAFRGVQLARGLSSLRWSGAVTRIAIPNLSDFAAEAARETVTSQLKPFGLLSRVDSTRRTLRAVSSPSLNLNVDVEERLWDRLDPARQLDKLSRVLWRRQQLTVLRNQHMYFYTELPRNGGRGLLGVNLNNGHDEREIKLAEPDYRLLTDEIAGLLYSAKDDKLFAHRLTQP